MWVEVEDTVVVTVCGLRWKTPLWSMCVGRGGRHRCGHCVWVEVEDTVVVTLGRGGRHRCGHCVWVEVEDTVVVTVCG